MWTVQEYTKGSCGNCERNRKRKAHSKRRRGGIFAVIYAIHAAGANFGEWTFNEVAGMVCEPERSAGMGNGADRDHSKSKPVPGDLRLKG